MGESVNPRIFLKRNVVTEWVHIHPEICLDSQCLQCERGPIYILVFWNATDRSAQSQSQRPLVITKAARQDNLRHKRNVWSECDNSTVRWAMNVEDPRDCDLLMTNSTLWLPVESQARGTGSHDEDYPLQHRGHWVTALIHFNFSCTIRNKKWKHFVFWLISVYDEIKKKDFKTLLASSEEKNMTYFVYYLIFFLQDNIHPPHTQVCTPARNMFTCIIPLSLRSMDSI